MRVMSTEKRLEGCELEQLYQSRVYLSLFCDNFLLFFMDLATYCSCHAIKWIDLHNPA